MGAERSARSEQPLAERFDVVDENDRVVDSRPGRECLKEGLLHRAIAVFLFDQDGRVYLQKRAELMAWYPGHWTVSVMGHVSSGETYEEAARREVKEELGLDCDVVRVTKVRTPRWEYAGMIEWEYLAVLEARVSNPRIVLSEETKEGGFVPLQEFIDAARAEPKRFTPDTILALDSYLESKRFES